MPIQFISIFYCLVFLSCNRSEKSVNKEVNSSNQSLTSTFQVSDTLQNIFSKIDFDKAIAYKIEDNPLIPLFDSKKNILRKIYGQVALDSNRIQELNIILTDTTTFGSTIPKDFYTEFIIIFYNRNKYVQHLEISLTCKAVFATFKIPEIDKRQYPDNGLTKNGLQKIRSFLLKIGSTS